ncbi:MAG: GSCFA domain-containing protein [Bacteroidia bacterium]|nr:GSCFA domain-containing protein [Bacteroidia bacterium]
MDQFRTTFQIADFEEPLTYHQSIFSIGSCFAEHMADRLKYFLFKVYSNPNGILYNPISLADSILKLLDRNIYQISDLIEHGGLWHSWDHHHSKSGTNPEELIQRMNDTVRVSAQNLENADVILVTFGTAFAYRYLATGQIVANCHKIPNTEFEKIRLQQNSIVGIWQDVLDRLFSANPKRQVIFTVSPIRHVKDGIVANQRSKAALLLSIEALFAQYPRVHYFPSYEIMMDDLRDYRFYTSDLIHPNKIALDYIWDLFKNTHIESATQSLMNEVDQLQKARGHRSMHPDSDAAKRFKDETEKKWVDFKSRYPFLNF